MGTVSGYCMYCYGSGSVRKRNQIGMVTLEMCKRCNGIGRRFMKEGSGEHRISSHIAYAGNFPGIRKHDNDRGVFRK